MSVLAPGRSYLLSGSPELTAPFLGEFAAFDRLTVDASQLDVKELRALISQLQLSAATSQRLLLVERAENLTEVMQNTLLKLLEEPPSTLVIIVQTTQPDSLLATVQSRLHRLSASGGPKAKPQTVLVGPITAVFDQLSKLPKEVLIETLATEMAYQRQLLLEEPSRQASRRLLLLDRAVKKIKSNSNLKLTLDWLLLHWEFN